MAERYERDGPIGRAASGRVLAGDWDLDTREVRPGTFREQGGVYVSFGRDGRPVFGLGGFHRLAMSLALDLERIPVQVGVVHRDGVLSWHDDLLG